MVAQEVPAAQVWLEPMALLLVLMVGLGAQAEAAVPVALVEPVGLEVLVARFIFKLRMGR